MAAQFSLLGILALAPTSTLWSLPESASAAATVGRLIGGVVILVGAARLDLAASVHPAPTVTARLQTTGAYRYARHPIYTGVLILATALVVGGRSFLHIAAWTALVLVLNLKARFEERLLAQRFPDYPWYAARTGRFLPIPIRSKRE